MKTPSRGKRRSDRLPLDDKLRLVRGMIMGFEGQISFDSGDGLVDGRFESTDSARKVYELLRSLILDLAIDLVDERVVSVRIAPPLNNHGRG
jgi:hypothetical protein